MDPDCEQVLAICRAVFETPLGLDDGFAEAGGHSILIARLAQQLQAAGWVVPVRALLTQCNTARKVAGRPRALQQASLKETAGAPVKSDESGREHDAGAAEVLSIEYFTTLQVLFAMLLYSPGVAAFLIPLSFVDVGTFFTTAGLWGFIIVGFFLYLLGLVAPFASLLWAMMIKLFMHGDIYKNNVSPGVYPKWSRMHLRIWCIGRLESIVLLTLRMMYRSAPLMAFVLRRLGASVGSNLQCAHDAELSGPLDLISIDDDVAIQTGAYIQTTRWSGPYLHVGRVHLESGCKIGMRAAIANNVTVGRGSWITPFTPILANVGSQEMWEGAPARLGGRCTELKRTASACRYACPTWVLETLNILMQIFITFWLIVVPTAAILWFATGLIPAGDAELSGEYFKVTPLFEIVWHLTLYAFITTGATVVVTSVAGLPVHALHARFAGAVSLAWPARCSPHVQNADHEPHPETVDLDRHRAVSARARRHALPAPGGLGVRPHVQPGAGACCRQFPGVLVEWLFHATCSIMAPSTSSCASSTCRGISSAATTAWQNMGISRPTSSSGVSTPGNDIQFRRQMRSRLGEPLTVAGNPPVKFASASFEAENEAHRPPGFPLFSDPPLPVRLPRHWHCAHRRGTDLHDPVYLFVTRRRDPRSPARWLPWRLQKSLSFCSASRSRSSSFGGEWGADNSTRFWSWRHFAYFFAQDCFFVWCRAPLGFCAGTVLSNFILRWMGCRIGRRTIVTRPMQCSDWNAVSFGNDCVVDGFLQFHSFENMTLKVKRTRIQDGCAVTFGATVMGGAVIERETTLLPLSLVLKEMNLPSATYGGSPAEPVSAASLGAVVDGAPRVTHPPRAVDNTDWLKTAAIILVAVDHFGHFFMEDDRWWAVFGRLAAPTFFFLMGYAQTRTIPRY